MFEPKTIGSVGSHALAPLDRLAIAYLTLPLVIFLIGWFEWWAAVPLAACSAYALRPLFMWWDSPVRAPLSVAQLLMAVGIGCTWTVLGGSDHLVFANFDWFVRDAVLHDLVVAHWPVGYGLFDGRETLLRAPLGFYLPAALIGKLTNLPIAYTALLVWTAGGTVLFLLQVFSLVDSRLRAMVVAAAVIVLFSGADIVGELLNGGPRFRSDWDIAMHLEWWAGLYQYSSMTTQLFWVPNHAIGGWLIVGLLFRCGLTSDLEILLPILLVAAAIWSPLTALGLVPFVMWRAAQHLRRGQSLRLLYPQQWLPALLVGLAVSGYLMLATGGVPKGSGLAKAWSSGDAVMSILSQTQFFLLEAGLIGLAILLIRRSVEMIIALAVLAVLPAVYFGPSNDLAMRGSIPALTVLALNALAALLDNTQQERLLARKVFLGLLLLIGAMTPIAEIARALMFPVWPINFRTTLVAANCGRIAPHYVAELGDQMITRILRPPNRLAVGPIGPESCNNPALEIMSRRYAP